MEIGLDMEIDQNAKFDQVKSGWDLEIEPDLGIKEESRFEQGKKWKVFKHS